jgi:hypothetical protein
MRIASGSTDRKVGFVAVDSTDLKTREVGLATFTVYRSRDGGAATLWTTPTIAELDATNMPGVYVLTIDEDTTVAAGHDVEEFLVHVTHAGMAPVTRAIEIERIKFTEGQSATVANSAVDADIERIVGAVVNTAAAQLGVNVVSGAADSITAAMIATDAIGSAELSAAAANKIADHILRRTYANARASANGDAVNFRTLLGAMGKLVNKWSISGSTLTVFQEDDATSTAPGGTQAITSLAGAEPITALDTA